MLTFRHTLMISRILLFWIVFEDESFLKNEKISRGDLKFVLALTPMISTEVETVVKPSFIHKTASNIAELFVTFKFIQNPELYQYVW